MSAFWGRSDNMLIVDFGIGEKLLCGLQKMEDLKMWT